MTDKSPEQDEARKLLIDADVNPSPHSLRRTVDFLRSHDSSILAANKCPHLHTDKPEPDVIAAKDAELEGVRRELVVATENREWWKKQCSNAAYERIAEKYKAKAQVKALTAERDKAVHIANDADTYRPLYEKAEADLAELNGSIERWEGALRHVNTELDTIKKWAQAQHDADGEVIKRLEAELAAAIEDAANREMNERRLEKQLNEQVKRAQDAEEYADAMKFKSDVARERETVLISRVKELEGRS